MNILSIQSHVSYGHVGNSAAAFALQRLGIEVWPVHTVAFSNHPGYGAWRGQVFDAEMVREVVRGIEERGVLGACAGVLSGYLGDEGIGEAVLDAVARVKRANPAALYCCDSVIGDAGAGVYVRPGVAAFMRRRAIPGADIVTPNLFELAQLLGREVANRAALADALDALHGLGPRVVLVTSVATRETPDDAVDLVVSDPRGRWRLRTPRIAIAVNGAGDLIAALFFAHLLAGKPAADAMALAAASAYGVILRTKAAGARELELIAAQDELVAPTHTFVPEPL